MIVKEVSLKGLCDTEARLVIYVPSNFSEIGLDKRRPSVLICPGGAYAHCSEREAEPIALCMVAAGMNAFILYYHVAPYTFPAPQQDAALAIKYIRDHADEYHAAPDKIAVLGFSAGGHLAASMGVMWHREELWAPFHITADEVKPNALVLCYPVITAGEFAHRRSFENLSGTKDIQVHQQYSLENLIDDRTPPSFLWHTMEDRSVPVQNSLLFALSMAKYHVPGEVHVYPHGVHGLSLGSALTATVGKPEQLEPCIADWIDRAISWLSDTFR